VPNITEILKEATEILHNNGIAEPRREANSLLAFALQKDRTFLITNNNYELSDAETEDFQAVLQRRARREPFQYITGRQEFYGLDFAVTPDVLIPRPETEMIVESAIEILDGRGNPRFCEIGVGSGCISVAILHNVQKSLAVGLDISEKALKIAGLNAGKHKVTDRLKLKVSDIFAALTDEKFDLIVSNPPYVPREDIKSLQAEVRDFEPLTSLTDGGSGLSIVEKIVREAPRFLMPEGILLMEIGFSQAEQVKSMFDGKIWRAVEILPDLQGIPRMVKAQTEN
jgi:release factor glutamine methyltransferase